MRSSWCGTVIPVSTNTPPCLSGRTLRTNDSLTKPTMWVHKGTKNCTGVRVNYNYYQFAASGVELQYRGTGDGAAICPASGTFARAALHPATQSCQSQSVLIPFGTSPAVYIRFMHPTGNSNAIWLDNVTLTLEGCSAC